MDQNTAGVSGCRTAAPSAPDRHDLLGIHQAGERLGQPGKLRAVWIVGRFGFFRGSVGKFPDASQAVVGILEDPGPLPLEGLTPARDGDLVAWDRTLGDRGRAGS